MADKFMRYDCSPDNAIKYGKSSIARLECDNGYSAEFNLYNDDKLGLIYQIAMFDEFDYVCEWRSDAYDYDEKGKDKMSDEQLKKLLYRAIDLVVAWKETAPEEE